MGKIKVIILAAGFGERFSQSIDKSVDLSDTEKENFFFNDGTDKPKGLLKIGGKEILLRNIDQLREIREIDLEKDVALITNHKYYKYFKEWMDQKELNIHVIDNGISEASERKGAVVDLHDAVSKINLNNEEGVLVIGSDILFDQFKIKELIEAYDARGGETSVFPIYSNDGECASKVGIVDFDPETKFISKFVEKPKESGSLKEFLVSPALYLYNKEALGVLSKCIKEARGRLSSLDSPSQFNEFLVKQEVKEANIEVLEVKGERFEISDYKDWRNANDYFYGNEAREHKMKWR